MTKQTSQPTLKRRTDTVKFLVKRETNLPSVSRPTYLFIYLFILFLFIYCFMFCMPDYRYVDFHIFIDCDLEQVIAPTVTNATIQYRLLILKVFVATLLMFLQYFFTFHCHSMPWIVNPQTCPFSDVVFPSLLLRSSRSWFFHCYLQTFTKTCLYSFDPLKPHFYIVKLGFKGVYIIFLISVQTINCGYSLEPPLRFMFWEEI